jgi:amino acid transporter
MGVLAARHLNSQFLSVHKGVVCLGWFVLSFILLTLCKFNFFAWLLLPVFVIGTAVTIVKLISRVRLLDGAFGWLGGLSGVLFVVHVTVRQVVLGNEKLEGYNYSAVAYYLVITFGLCIMLRSVFSSKKE